MALKAGQTDSETRKKRNYLYQRVFTSERIALEKRLKLVRKKHQINTGTNIFAPSPRFCIFVISSNLNLVNNQL